jgi:cytosine/adenosine deaminase-related metal-dependent hydrolase
MRRIASHYALTPDGLLPGRVVTVDEAGVILDISAPEHIDRESGVEFYPGILTPGFVNAHCHLELSHLREAIPPGGGFAAFVEGMRKAVRCNSEDAAHIWDTKMWAEGVSAVGDICNGSSTFALKRASRIRYYNFIEIFGTGADPGKAFALCGEAAAMGLATTVTPHALYSLSPENFAAAVGRNADGDKNRPLSIHFMESDFEVPSPAARLVAQTPPDRPVMLIHNCTVTQRDIDIVMEHFTAPVTWVLCPGSNRYISGLTPPVELLRKNGLNIAVGTDSLASNETLSVVRELFLLGDIPLRELLDRATIGGAKALGMDGTLGSIEAGKSPGLAVLSGVDFEKMALTENSRAQRII